MFRRKERFYLQVSGQEFRLIWESLLRWRNKLLAQGNHADPINELLGKLMTR